MTEYNIYVKHQVVPRVDNTHIGWRYQYANRAQIWGCINTIACVLRCNARCTWSIYGYIYIYRKYT